MLPQLTLGVRPLQRHRSAAGARDPQRPLLAAGRHLPDRRAVQRSRRRTRAAAVAAGRPQRSAAADVDAAAAAASASGRPRCGCRWTPTSSACAARSKSSAAIDSITITPTDVVDAGARPLVPTVLAAATYHGASLFFHDEQMYPEAAGLLDAGPADLATHGRGAARPAPRRWCLRMHRGGEANIVTFTHLRLGARLRARCRGAGADVELPMFDERRDPVDDRRRDAGFHPTDLDPSSTDRRFLGVWVEVKTGDGNTMTTLADLRREYASRALTEARCRTPIRSGSSRCGSTRR